MGGSHHLLALFAHPDDEVYSAGGTLALCAGRGARVVVICATRGEGGAARYPSASIEATGLGKVRTEELMASCATLGTLPPVFLDLPDGRVADLDPAHAGDRLIEILDEERPEVIITHGRDGAYGHVDHLATTSLLERTLPRLPWAGGTRVLHAAFPKGVMAPAWRSLRRLPGVVHPDVDLEALGLTADQADLRVHVAGVRTLKLAALGCHRSQLRGGDPMSFLRPGLIASLLDEEWFTVAAGPPLPPGAENPFEGL